METDHLDKQERINHAEWENPKNWKFGLFYSCQKDLRTWVPKRSMFGRRRFGGTPNFAHKSARQHMMIIVGVCVLVFLAVISIENSFR